MADELVDKLGMLRGLYSKYHENVRENRRYYNLDFRNEVVPAPPEGDAPEVWPVMATTARRAIDDPADHILPSPRIQIPIRPTDGDANVEAEIAERKRDFLSAWWESEENEFGAIAAARKILLNEGRVVVRKQLKWDMIPDYPGKDASRSQKIKYRKEMNKLGDTGFLWRVELLDNLSVYEDPSNPRDPQYVFVEYDIFVEEAKRLFGNAVDRQDDYSTVTYTEYWSKPRRGLDGSYQPGEFVQFIDDAEVRRRENPYPYVPIAIEDAGYGVSHHLAKPHERYVGMTQFAHDIFIAESRQMTTLENVAEITGFPAVKSRNMDPSKRIHVGPRQVIPMDGNFDDPSREDIEVVQWPPVPITVIQMLQKTSDMANETLKMNQLGGIPQSGVETATEADQTVRNAAAKLEGPVAALQRLIVKMSQWVLMDVESVIESRVSVYGTLNAKGATSLGPKDIKGYYAVSAELTTSDKDALSQSKARFWLDAYNATPFLSAMTAMVNGDITDEPLRELVRRSAEDVFISDLMRQARAVAGGQMFGQLAQMIEGLQRGTNGNQLGRRGQEQLQAGGVDETPTDRIEGQAYADRNINQAAALNRGANAG